MTFRVELAHSEKLDNPLLHLGQAEMVGIEDSSGFADLDPVGFRLLPRQFDQPVEIGAQQRILG